MRGTSRRARRGLDILRDPARSQRQARASSRSRYGSERGRQRDQHRASTGATRQSDGPAPGCTRDSQMERSPAWRASGARPPGRWDLMPAAPIENLAAELLANHNLLAALAGPAIALTVDAEGGARPGAADRRGPDPDTGEPGEERGRGDACGRGRIQIESAGAGRPRPEPPETLLLTIEDNGPGIPAEAQDEIFNSGYTTRGKAADARGSWPVIHRGLGLAITRSMVESAGGRITLRTAPWGARVSRSSCRYVKAATGSQPSAFSLLVERQG